MYVSLKNAHVNLKISFSKEIIGPTKKATGSEFQL